ncbi:MAG TPA: bifunctional phosphoribosylaminoimidazolecarboxamide formyltransferase/IMP cyclohydrolase [Pyrinomonadaceae bacterium]
MTEPRSIKRALISLSDKTGAADFARRLAGFGVEIISTGGTAAALRDAGLRVTDVADVTGFPEMMDGRVKTLHPKIHGAFLALRDNEAHVASMREHGIDPIDMVVINLYPFEESIARNGVTLEDAVENIDIGGPAMIRSASKNWRDVVVVTDPRLYDELLVEMESNNGSVSLETRQRLAVLAYTRTASYDIAISSYLAKQITDDQLALIEPLNPLQNLAFIESEYISDESDSDSAGAATTSLEDAIELRLSKAADLRYGENPHQKAALYTTGESGGLAGAEQLHGKEMSFNNYVDADAAWNLVQDLEECAVAIIKHTNPSGVGIGNSNLQAYRRALSTDPVSAFGGIVAFNRPVDADAARSVIEVFSEVIVAPEYEPEAIEIFRSKKNLRLLKIQPTGIERQARVEYKQISGGMLVQEADNYKVTESDFRVVSERNPTPEEIRALLLAWRVCKHVKSNAIVLANEYQTIGVGSGQMNRVDSVRIAEMRAGRFDLPVEGSALASDAFFPFRDNVDEAAKMGVTAIIQPGGSVKDADSIAAANEHRLAMVFTGVRHFKH